jgi:hypothetical protein
MEMRMILSASLIVLGLVVAEPALAHCGASHAASKAKAVRAPATANKVAKKDNGKATEVEKKSQPETTALADPAGDPGLTQRAPAGCKQYSVALGTMVAVPCS